MKKTLCALILATTLGCESIKTKDNPHGYLSFQERIEDESQGISLNFDIMKFFQKPSKKEYKNNEFDYLANTYH